MRRVGTDDNRRMSTPLPLAGAAALNHWGVIRARGADAASFLHGQLTSDITALNGSQARLAGYCSAKGRLLASFIVWKQGDDVLLACSADLLAPTLKRLSMFVLRAQCKLSDASAEVRLYGLAGESARNWLNGAEPSSAWSQTQHEGATVIRLSDSNGDARYLWAAENSVAAPSLPELALSGWRWAEVTSGVPTIELATVDQFVPQMLNFELLGGVDFKKGCYPGQEVVARSQYRGTIKRRTYLFQSSSAACAAQEIFHSADPSQPAGLVANAATVDGTTRLLAEIKLASLDSGSLHLGAADGPVLTPLEMPYLVTTEAE